MSEEKEVVEGGVLVWGNENAPEMDTLRAAIKNFYGGRRPGCLTRLQVAVRFRWKRCGWVRGYFGGLESGGLVHSEMHTGLSAAVRGEEMAAAGLRARVAGICGGFHRGQDQEAEGRHRSRISPTVKQIQLLALPDADLAWHVRAWGRGCWNGHGRTWRRATRWWMASRRWPTCGRDARDPQTTGRIPLLKTLWLGKKKGKRTALLPVPNSRRLGGKFQTATRSGLRATAPHGGRKRVSCNAGR